MKKLLISIYLLAYAILSCILFVPAIVIWLFTLPFDKQVSGSTSIGFGGGGYTSILVQAGAFT